MMTIQDSFTKSEDTDLNKYILTYIRVLEEAQFKEIMKKNYFTKNMRDCDLKIDHSNLDLMDISEDYTKQNDLFDSDESCFTSKIPVELWGKIVQVLNNCNDNNNMKELFANYRKILKLHIEHKIYVYPQCFSCLVYCTKPEYIQSLFNENLIRYQDQKEMGVCFFQKHLFNGLDLLNTSNVIQYLNPLVCSLIILLYKTKCQAYSKSIVEGLNQNLAVYINKETSSLKRTTMWKDFKNVTLKHLLKCIYLNGIFSQESMKNFLNNKEIMHQSDSTENDSDDWPSESEDMNYWDENNNYVRGLDLAFRLSVGERIKSSFDTTAINNIFPMSLKNLTRLKIKSSLVNTSVKSARKLTILPNVLRKFVSFQDEINAVLKL